MWSTLRNLVERVYLRLETPPETTARRRWLGALFALALSVLVIVHSSVGDIPTPGLAAVVGVVIALCTIDRRHRPTAMLWIAVAARLVLVVVNGSRDVDTVVPGAADFATVLIVYSVGRWAPQREIRNVAAFSAGVVVLDGLLQSDTNIFEAFLGEPLPWLLVGLVGVSVRHANDLRARRQVEARLSERNDLAREIHDVVAHHVSAIAVQADAALAVRATDPDAGNEALEAIRRTASLALTEMRTMVGALRGDDSAELAPTAGRADLERLVEAQPPHPAVELHIDGIDDLAATTAAALYRLTQESVTNARRHSRNASHIIIDISHLAEPDRVRLVVTDDGEHQVLRGQGYGLVGMRERVESLGGSFSASPRPGRGWEVRAELPVGGRR